MSIATGVDAGARLRGPVTNLALAAVANAAAILQISNWTIAAGGQQIGTKSARIKRVFLMNNAAGNTTVIIGTGAGATFVALLPALVSFNGLNEEYGEDRLPAAEAFVDITAYPVALAVGGSIDIQIEVEEIG